jgi:hypothetical protein
MLMRLPLLWLLTALVAFAEPPVTKIVRVKGDAIAIAGLVGNRPDFRIEGNRDLHAILLRGDAGQVQEAERIIQALDGVPGDSSAKDIELTVHILGGDVDASRGATEAKGDALAAVIKQLRGLFPYEKYYTLGTVLLRSGQESKVLTNGALKTPLDSGDKPAQYEIVVNSLKASDEAIPTIHVASFRFHCGIPVQKNGGLLYFDTGTTADLDLKEGQKVVVANLELGNTNSAIFLVVSARTLR